MSYKVTDTILCLDKVNLGYPDDDNPGKMKLVLKDISLIEKDIVREGHAATGQIIAVLARSGRGKSTLFRAITGLSKPISGKVLIPNFNTGAKDDAKEVEEGDVGFVDQKYTLFRHKTLSNIFEYAMRKSKATPIEKSKIIGDYLENWGLKEHRNKYSSELSGGQRQRTAIIEQLLTSKHFIILDEPFSGLDVGNIEKVKVAFDKILTTDEINTIIFSTHDIHLAVELADSIYVIGHPDGVTDYSTIIKHYDLKEMGLAWEPYDTKHRELADEIKQLLVNS